VYAQLYQQGQPANLRRSLTAKTIDRGGTFQCPAHHSFSGVAVRVHRLQAQAGTAFPAYAIDREHRHALDGEVCV
jgi:hypothetical protein